VIRQGRVTSAPGPTGLVAVTLSDAQDCARCARGDGCQRLGFGASRAVTLDCRVTGEAPGIGRAVRIAVPDDGSGWLLPLGIAYGLPSAALVIGSLVGERLGGAGLGALGGLSALALGVWLSPRAARGLMDRFASRPPHPCCGPHAPRQAARPGQDTPRIVSVAATHSPL